MTSCNHDCNQGRACVCATPASLDTMQAEIDAGFDTWDAIFERLCLGIALLGVGAAIGIVVFASLLRA